MRSPLPLRLMTLTLLCALVSALCTGCGAGCRRADQAWQASAPVAADRAGPHWRLDLDRREVDARLNELIDTAPTASWVTQSPLKGVSLPALTLRLKALSWAVNEERMNEGQDATLSLEVGVYEAKDAQQDKRQELLSLSLKGRSPVLIDEERRTLSLKVRADQFKRAELRLGKGSKRAMKRAIKRWLPDPLKRLTPAQAVTKGADELLKRLSSEGYDLLRAHLLTKIGTLTELEWALPELPIERVTLALTPHAWRVELYSSVAGPGLSPSSRSRGPLKGARVWASAPWLTSLSAYAMERGDLPSRFSVKGEPEEGGPARVRLTWEEQSAERPLKAHLWASRAQGAPLCLYARVGVDPQLKLKPTGALKLKGVGQVEQIEGNPFAELAARLTGVTERQLAWHTKASLPAHLKTSAGRLAWRWGEAEMSGEALSVALELASKTSKTSKRLKKPKRATTKRSKRLKRSR